MNYLLNKHYTAAGAIAAFRIVKPGADDGEAAQAAAATDALMGVNESVATDDGEGCDVVKVGIADVEFGGTVAAGDPVTSDADGKAVKAEPDAGTNARIIGFAEVAAVAGDIAPVLIAPGVLQG
jgi:hypothetical protein